MISEEECGKRELEIVKYVQLFINKLQNIQRNHVLI